MISISIARSGGESMSRLGAALMRGEFSAGIRNDNSICRARALDRPSDGFLKVVEPKEFARDIELFCQMATTT